MNDKVLHKTLNNKYHSMRGRCKCRNPKTRAFKTYGVNGIKVEWTCFEDFKRDMYQSFLAHVKEHGIEETTLDRIDNSKDYSKENCRWATKQMQNDNRRVTRWLEIDGMRKTFPEWCRFYGVSPSIANSRVGKHGWDLIRAVSTPHMVKGVKRGLPKFVQNRKNGRFAKGLLSLPETRK